MQQQNDKQQQNNQQYHPQYTGVPYQSYSPMGQGFFFKENKIEVKPTFGLAWGLMWRMWILAIPVYIALLILQLALK